MEGIVGVCLVLLKRVQSDMRLAYAVIDPAAVEIAYNIVNDLLMPESFMSVSNKCPTFPWLAWIAQLKTPKTTAAIANPPVQATRRNLDE